MRSPSTFEESANFQVGLITSSSLAELVYPPYYK